MARRFVRGRHDPQELFVAGGGVLGHPGYLHSLGWQQMGDRGTLCAASGARASGTSWMGSADLQRCRGTAQPLEPLLDVAAAGLTACEGARPCRLFGSA